MQLVDWIAIGVLVVTLLFGIIFGFGKLLKFFTGGIFGFIISIVVTYCSIGFVASLGFVQQIMGMLIEAMQGANNGFVDFLLNIGIEKIILGVILFVVVQIIRILIVKIIKGIVEIDNVVVKVINKIGGVIFMAAVMILIVLIVFHVVQLIGGETAMNFRASLEGVFRLDWVYDNNPLQYIIAQVIPQ